MRVFHKVRSKANGGIYIIDDSMLKSSKNEWELVEVRREVKEVARIQEVPEEVVEVQEEKKEITADEIERTYTEMKEILRDHGVDFKGNASKEYLIKLIEERIKK